ncbi:MAG: hypothetical protein LBL69_00825, partial [Zoogloeaceae bacterium]|nr:hypothetical protein [Zoogloeaceae bacterium]
MRRLSLLLLLPAVAGVVWGVSFWKEVHRPPAIEIPASSDGFWVAQQQFSRVREAWRDKGAGIVDTLAEHGLATNDLNILLVAFKDEGQLQLYGKHQAEDKFRLLKTFGIVRKSGELGPKWQEGDKQVPEGIYRIDRFNPKSSYHLSLGLDYPNAADRKRSQAEKLGGDIF